MKKVLIALGILSTINLSFAQKYKFKADEHKGEIFLKEGGSRKGYIDMKGGKMTPWGNQSSVKFFSEDALADGKVKGKEREKYKPKGLAGYSVDGREFESIKTSYKKLSMGIGIMQFKFVERLTNGNVKLFKLYETPEPVSAQVGEEAIAAHKKELERMRNEPMYFIIRNGGSQQKLEKVNISQLISDCPEVKEKYESGGYGVEPFNSDAKTALGKTLANQANAQQTLEVLPEILNEYNDCVK